MSYNNEMAASVLKRSVSGLRLKSTKHEKCEDWILRLNKKYQDEAQHTYDRSEQCNLTSSVDRNRETVEVSPSNSAYCCCLFKRKTTFKLTVIDYDEAKAWATSCMTEDRMNYEYIQDRVDVNGRKLLPRREWSWDDLERWYMATCSLGYWSQAFAIEKLKGPRCGAFRPAGWEFGGETEPLCRKAQIADAGIVAKAVRAERCRREGRVKTWSNTAPSLLGVPPKPMSELYDFGS